MRTAKGSKKVPVQLFREHANCERFAPDGEYLRVDPKQGVYRNISKYIEFHWLFYIRTSAVIFEFYMVSRRPGRHLKMIPRLVASFSQSMSPWRIMATHFVPKSIVINMSKTCHNDKKPHNFIHSLSKWSIDIKNSTNVPTKTYAFDIHLPQGSLFDNPDYVYLALGTQHVLTVFY